MKLTKPQSEELQRLARGRQSTRGGHRARVQNSLRAKGLAQFCDADGGQRELSIYEIVGSYGNPREFCEITRAGRELLKEAS